MRITDGLSADIITRHDFCTAVGDGFGFSTRTRPRQCSGTSSAFFSMAYLLAFMNAAIEQFFTDPENRWSCGVAKDPTVIDETHLLQWNLVIPQGCIDDSEPQKHFTEFFFRQGGHSPSWQVSEQLWMPQANFLSQLAKQFHDLIPQRNTLCFFPQKQVTLDCAGQGGQGPANERLNEVQFALWTFVSTWMTKQAASECQMKRIL